MSKRQQVIESINRLYKKYCSSDFDNALRDIYNNDILHMIEKVFIKTISTKTIFQSVIELDEDKDDIANLLDGYRELIMTGFLL